jgi:CRP/FNR family transcriptional regulator, cyclic AMP receptor protein
VSATTQEQIDFRGFARALGTVMSYAADDIIFRENDPPAYMCVVLSGSVEISSRQKPLETVRECQAIGILALLDGQPRTIAARAIERCELALIDKKKFRYMVEEVPNFVWYVMGELANRLRATNAAL